MKIKYRNQTLYPNYNPYCINCAVFEYTKAHRTCFALCCKTNSIGGFNIINDCEILEL